MALSFGLQRRYKMVDEKLIIAELVKAVKENRITLKQVPIVYKKQINETLRKKSSDGKY